MKREKIMIGDLVQTTLGYVGIVLERNTQTETGQHWWRVWNIAKNRLRIVGEWELTRLS